jgi:hypothetical protein
MDHTSPTMIEIIEWIATIAMCISFFVITSYIIAKVI